MLWTHIILTLFFIVTLILASRKFLKEKQMSGGRAIEAVKVAKVIVVPQQTALLLANWLFQTLADGQQELAHHGDVLVLFFGLKNAEFSSTHLYSSADRCSTLPEAALGHLAIPTALGGCTMPTALCGKAFPSPPRKLP